jgi:hypothetical protein
MDRQGGDWGGMKIRELWMRDGQTVKQCTMACDVWEFAEFILVMVTEIIIGRRERPAIETIITG